MCLAVLALDQVPEYPLILIANRDEFYDRPTLPLQWWTNHPDLLAGIDKKMGGTWLGITRKGRYALITNYREFPLKEKFSTSRGTLVTDFLLGDDEPSSYAKKLEENSSSYDGYNLIWGDNRSTHYFSNKGNVQKKLGPGLYGLSNHLLDTHWPKVAQAKNAFARVLDQSDSLRAETLLGPLQDTTIAPDENLPNTGIGLEWERALSPCFIKTDKYGTRSSTVLLVHQSGKVRIEEWSFHPKEQNNFYFQINT